MRPILAALLLAGFADAFNPLNRPALGAKRSGFLGLFGQEKTPVAVSSPTGGSSGWLSQGRRGEHSPTALTATVEDTRTSSGKATKAAKTDLIGDYCAKHGGDRPIRKILIANNGMAATKSIMSMRQWAYMELGDEKAIEFVAMATPEDMKANAEFIKLADSFVEVPAGKNVNNYANVDVIVKIAQDKGVDAVWPGWGHASENPRLPDALDALGIKFIGPNSKVMAALGDKIAANILAQTAGVPSIPWSGDGLTAELNDQGQIPQDVFDKAMVTTASEALAAANRIGYPVMLKASEGGGGKGIRMSNSDEELAVNFVQVQNEVPGSPMFMMQLCQGARHLEVQIVGDAHGNAVALNGRDCSTQRRFQKIFEEGPPVIAKPETFKEMERAAQRLTQSIGYQGAGTVEYLYNAAADEFFFLELNPRLQVEHPVTEGISLVNMPATQLQVAMGIPLTRIPDIRRFYAKPDPEDGDSSIDFLADDYRPIDTHVIAARITAENPDEGFKPTSGTIERVKFQSTTNVWGYFSVGANGGIHEFADSQFGHLFARGPTRESARRSLVLALKEIEVLGTIRSSVDYLVQLLETEEFKENTIDTAWLDGIIREKSVSTELEPHTTVAAAAIYRAFSSIKAADKEHEEALAKGQLSMNRLASATSFPLDVTYKEVKYAFSVTRLSADSVKFTILGSSFVCDWREQPDGSLLASFGGLTRKIVGQEEPLGLRVVLDGTTCLLPSVFDPSELRTDVTGKVVRYLQEEGAVVTKGQPYCEVEAMKMIMPLKATESGSIKHALSSGSIISAGDLLASLTLKDPGMVKKILPFAGQEFDVCASTPAPTRTPLEKLKLLMAGFAYSNEEQTLVQQLVVDNADGGESLAGGEGSLVGATLELLDQFIEVEKHFSGLSLDAANLKLVKDNAENLDKVVAINLAHSQLKARTAVVLALLRACDTSASGSQLGLAGGMAEIKERLAKLTDLTGRDNAAIMLQAAEMLDKEDVTPFATRVEGLRATLVGVDDVRDLSKSDSLSAGVELLSSLFADDDATVRSKAVEAYVRRVYRAHDVLDVTVTEGSPGQGYITKGSFAFKYADVGEEAQQSAPLRKGHISVLPTAVNVNKDGWFVGSSLFDSAALAKVVGAFEEEVQGLEVYEGTGLHNLHISFGPDSGKLLPGSPEEKAVIGSAEKLIGKEAARLVRMGVRQIDLVVPQGAADPRYFSFTQCNGFKEDSLRRDMRPTFVHLLELRRLQDNFDLVRFPALGRNSQAYLGVDRNAVTGRAPKPRVLFVRSIAHDPGLITAEGADKALVSALDQLDRSTLDSRVTVTTSSRVFVNLLAELELTPEQCLANFKSVMGGLLAKHATRLLKNKVDEIEIKVRCKLEGGGGLQSVRLVASSMGGKWLDTSAFLEEPDAVTGVTKSFRPIGQGAGQSTTLQPYTTSNKLQLKRTACRRISSTYAYDFLGLLEVDLIQRWGAHVDSLKAAGVKLGPDSQMPEGWVFVSKELILDEVTGVLRDDVVREVGTNTVGMLAWACFMKTPEYPQGREVVVVANDVTVQSGSFGVKEDDFFEAASKYARSKGLPRVYIACNSGARIGLVESLKPLFKVAWKDDANPGQGFEYLYLTDEDFQSLPEGTVVATKKQEGAEVRWALDDIIGKIHGIGVENLRGSGTIAGETARAYDDVFTLSYVTGRSVGIGAYLVRLGQRTIQMEVGPLILTGYSALNKLLGREVYNSQDQLGGPEVMAPNGVSHLVVPDDQAGVKEIMDWLSFVPATNKLSPPQVASADPVDRKVAFLPTKAAYDPRHMLAGVDTPSGFVSGFFDKGSFKEYLAEWGKSVVVGRARLGGIPMGVIAVETRLVEQRIPADPANPASREALMPQAGQVWYPDSAYKTAQAIADFGKGENLPLIIFANWRGFSGGTRDMAGEILKFGAMIVDALIKYEHPVQVYIPPNGELRGGAWVVIDPTINAEVMEMYCDKESRGGILEPPGICEVKFRGEDQIKKMHQLDPVLVALDAELEAYSSEVHVGGSSNEDAAHLSDLAGQIKDREASLLPLYLQVAHEFADLHDRSGRMKAKGVVRDVLNWPDSREYMYWRVKRRLCEQGLVKSLKSSGSGRVSHADAEQTVQELVGGAAVYEDDKAFLGAVNESVLEQVALFKTKGLSATVSALLADLTPEQKAQVLGGL